MVRKKTTIPPVYPLSLAGLGAFFALEAFAQASGALLAVAVPALAAAAFFSACAALPFTSRPGTKLARIAFFAAAGTLVGALSHGVVASERREISTLAPRESIESVTVEFLSDPAPYGDEWYRAPCQILKSLGKNGERWSARGRCAVFLPAAMVRDNCPGSLSSGPKAVLFSQGLVANVSGSLLPYDPLTGEKFRVAAMAGTPVGWTGLGSYRRALIRLSLARVLYDWGDSGGFLFALLSGNRDYLSPALANDFKRTGLAHILALSGTHLSLMALVAIKVGKRAGGKRLSVKLSVIAILAFVWFAGLSPSLSRSLVMAILLTATQWIGFRVSVLPVLALSAFLQMGAAPDDALSLAYALSYGALLGILTAGERLRAFAAKYVPENIASPLCASVGAMALTTPVLAASVGTIAPVGVIASCFVELPSSAYLVGGMALAAVAAAFPPVSALCGAALGVLYSAIAGIVGFFAACDPLSIVGLPATMTVIAFSAIAYAFAMISTAQCKKRRSADVSFARL